MIIQVPLRQIGYCDGCPCKVSLFSHHHCLLYSKELKVDFQARLKEDYMKITRPQKCRLDNGE